MEGTIPENWDRLDAYLHINGLQVTQVRGNGFCILNAVAAAMYHDLLIPITIDKIKNKIFQYLKIGGRKYLQWYNGTEQQLLQEAKDFFASGNFNTNFCDLMIQICADALNVNICVYQKKISSGEILMIHHQVPSSQECISLKFHYNRDYNAVNHYDAITKLQKSKARRILGNPEMRKEVEESEEEELELSQQSRGSEDFPIDLTVQKSAQQIQIENYLNRMHQGVPFPFHFFDHVTSEEVDKLPSDLDGLKKYKIKGNACNFMEKARDRRHFQMSKSSIAARGVIRRVGKCRGSYKCINSDCSFVSTQNRHNTSKFNNFAGLKICHSCGKFAHKSVCNARKLIDFDENEGIVYVYHIGVHTCNMKPDNHKFDEIIRKEVENNKNLGPKKLKLKLMKEQVDKGKFSEAKEVAEVFADSRRVKLIRQSILRGEDDLLPNSMEAVAEVKKGSDTTDTFHIYKINSMAMNNLPDYVFKTSRVMLVIALMMDQDGPRNSLQEELCFFDGAHSRVNNFVALAAWVLHPSMRMLFRLASMEVRSESHTTVEIFWGLFNECLQQVKKEVHKQKEVDKEYKFNPKGWMVDEAGSNFKGMETVFGEEAALYKMKTCQWHFLHQAQSKASRTNEYEEEVLEICQNMCTVTTVVQYRLLLTRLYEIAALYPDFKAFVDWWDARRFHVFAVFRDFSLPGVNLAEIGNAGWKRSGKLSLVEAARDDITTMLVQEREYLDFSREDIPAPSGRGPTDKKRTVKSRKKQMQMGKEVSEMLMLPEAVDAELRELRNPEFFKPNAKATHKSRKKGKEGKKKRKSNVESTSIPNLVAQLDAAKALLAESPQSTFHPALLGQSKNRRSVRPLQSTPSNPNPPMITFQQGLGISRCQGCPSQIQEKNAPLDLVFRIKAIRPFLNKKTGMWQDAIGNAYCHLDVGCLKSHNPDVEEEKITMEDKTFMQCKDEHMRYLNEIGLLAIVVRNKSSE